MPRTDESSDMEVLTPHGVNAAEYQPRLPKPTRSFHIPRWGYRAAVAGLVLLFGAHEYGQQKTLNDLKAKNEAQDIKQRQPDMQPLLKAIDNYASAQRVVQRNGSLLNLSKTDNGQVATMFRIQGTLTEAVNGARFQYLEPFILVFGGSLPPFARPQDPKTVNRYLEGSMIGYQETEADGTITIQAKPFNSSTMTVLTDQRSSDWYTLRNFQACRSDNTYYACLVDSQLRPVEDTPGHYHIPALQELLPPS